ncbi:MAG: hypothetical protein ACI906_003293 [Candidatus Latescibacterota bacterium]|jgi:hypothetical protein
MKKTMLRALAATMLIWTGGASAQMQTTPEMVITTSGITTQDAPSARAALDYRLEMALDLGQEQRAHLEQLRQALQGQLQSIRTQVEERQLGEEEVRWQVKMALAGHRQSRAALLTDEQTNRLEMAYNTHAQSRGQQPPGLPLALRLSEAQEEQMRMLLWSQSQEWRILQESSVPPTADQIQALRLAHRVAFEHLLSSRQFELLQQMKNARRRHYGLEEEEPVDTPTLLDDAPDTGE